MYDAIVVGGGHNGLTCGAYLAKSGLKTLVLERRHIVGGAAVTEEIHPGFRASRFSYIMGHVHPKVIGDLELGRFGLEHLPIPDIVHPTEDGQCITFTTDQKRNLEQIARFSRHDAEVFPQFFASMSETIAIIRDLLLQTPFDLSRRDWKTAKEGLKLLYRYRRLGNQYYRLMDAMTMSAYDYLSEWFESDIIRAMFCFWTAIGDVSPRSGGSAYTILYHLVGENGMGFSRGGMGSISESIARSGRQYGMEIKTESPVAQILTRNGRACGVRLENGDTYEGALVVSNVAAPITFGRMVDQAELPTNFKKQIGNYRASGGAFKINLAVDQPPQYRGFDPATAGIELPSYAHIGPTTDYLEQAFDDAKYGRYSRRPYVSSITPSLIDDTLAPEGKHVVTLCGGQAPYELKDASWEDEKDNFIKIVLDIVDEFAPGFSDSIIAMDAMVPPDFERILNLPRGHELHGECTVDQLFMMRPVEGYADYRSPIRHLYQCGASTHPGGGVSCVPGHNAAREILKDWKSIRRNFRH